MKKAAASKATFVKTMGAGNDFVLVDARLRSVARALALGFDGDPRSALSQRIFSRLAQRWCDRKRGIGADGLLVVLPSKTWDARMRIFNPDGSEASMCGNGLRCVAWYLSRGRSRSRSLTIETGAGPLRAQVVKPERVRIFFNPPKGLRLGLRLTLQGRRYELHAVNTGVPHAVLLTPELGAIPVEALGSRIRHHRLFQPEGTNVNWLKVISPHRAQIRTYERGVEAETLACGTGAVASVVVGFALRLLEPPVEVVPKGGEILTVGFQPDLRPWEDLYLEGSARIVFEGSKALDGGIKENLGR